MKFPPAFLFFIIITCYTKILLFDNSAIDLVFIEKRQAMILLWSDNDASMKAKEALREYDATHPQMILLSSSKSDRTGLFDRLSQHLGVSHSQTPAIFYLQNASKKYQFLEEITSERLAAFVERAQSQSIKPYLKSAPLPQKNDLPVKIIVGHNFKDVVLNSDQEILLQFYAPWCSTCKAFASHFQEAASTLLTNPNILFAQINSNQNEIQEIQINELPTIKFWRKDKSVGPIDFNGDRTADGIVEWIKEHTEYDWIEPNIEGEAMANQL